jgi:hypothetical protein
MKQVPLFYVKVNPYRGKSYIAGDLDGYYRCIALAKKYRQAIKNADVKVVPMYVYDEVDDKQFAQKYLSYELDSIWNEPNQTWIPLEVHEKTTI